MMMDPIFGKISYNCYVGNSFNLELRNSAKIFLVKIKRATGKEIVQHLLRPAKVIPTSCFKASYAQHRISIQRLWIVRNTVEERWERRMVGMRMIVQLTYVLIARIQSIESHPYIFLPMVACVWNTYHYIEFQEHWSIGPSANLTSKQPELATGLGNPPAVRVWTPKTSLLGSRLGQTPNPLTVGRPRQDRYPSIRGFHQVLPHLSGPISGSGFWVLHVWSHLDMVQ